MRMRAWGMGGRASRAESGRQASHSQRDASPANEPTDQDRAPGHQKTPGRPAAGEERFLVGLAAGAGSQPALARFFANLPADTGLIFLAFTDVTPIQLQPHTDLSVTQVSGLVALETDHVYLLSPARRVVITSTQAQATAAGEESADSSAVETAVETVNDFLHSLAACLREHRPDTATTGAAVIFSGAEPTVAAGVRAVKDAGGRLLVQDPDEAADDRLPRAAVATGLADRVLPATQLAQQIAELGARWRTRPRPSARPRPAAMAQEASDRTALERELGALRQELARQQQRLARRTRTAEMLAAQLAIAEHTERQHIAQILHDDLQQQLYALQIQLQLVRDGALDDQTRQDINKMAETIKRAVQLTRNLGLDLSPYDLQELDLTEALRKLAEGMREHHGLDVTLEVEGSIATPNVAWRALLFRAVRELLLNVVRHAETSEATIYLQMVDDPQVGPAYRVEIVDGGKGFDPAVVETVKDGSLATMRRRLRLVSGRLELKSTPDSGTLASVVLPAPPPTPDDM